MRIDTTDNVMPARFNPRRLWLFVGLLCVVSLLAYLVVSRFTAQDPANPLQLRGLKLYQPGVEITGVQLQDQHGQLLTAQSLQGRWWFVFFGYTHCPDVCATTLLQLAAVDRAITSVTTSGKPPGYLFVSVDPARDGREQLDAYVSFFGADFTGATAVPGNIRLLEQQFDAYHQLEPADANGNYRVTHSNFAYLLDPAGHLTARFEPPFDPIAVTRVFTALRARSGENG